jgi:Multicopper oxidase
MLSEKPDAVRKIAFEICSDVRPFMPPENRLPSCGWYFLKYDPTYWGGAPFNTLEMMRDADDVGVPTGNKVVPRISYKKEGLFDPTQPLFPDMIAGNYEEWTVYNRTFSDHPFHLHQNHVLITTINGTTLPLPEWHDTLDVPAAVCRQPDCPPGNLNDATQGSITFRTYFNPVTVGCFVGHCHTLDHEDLGMMQRFDILPAKGVSSGCGLDRDTAALPLIERLIASRGSFRICSAPRQSYSPTPSTN